MHLKNKVDPILEQGLFESYWREKKIWKFFKRKPFVFFKIKRSKDQRKIKHFFSHQKKTSFFARIVAMVSRNLSENILEQNLPFSVFTSLFFIDYHFEYFDRLFLFQWVIGTKKSGRKNFANFFFFDFPSRYPKPNTFEIENEKKNNKAILYFHLNFLIERSRLRWCKSTAFEDRTFRFRFFTLRFFSPDLNRDRAMIQSSIQGRNNFVFFSLSLNRS